MRVRRRLRFAAPLVLVACHHRPPATGAPATPPTSIDAARAPEVDAAIDAPIDAAIDAPGTIAIGDGPISCHNFGHGTHCNPPRHPPPPPTTTSYLTAAIVGAAHVADGSIEITIGAGTARGVAKGDHGVVLGLKGGFVIDTVTERSSRARVEATMDDVKAANLVRIEVHLDP